MASEAAWPLQRVGRYTTMWIVAGFPLSVQNLGLTPIIGKHECSADLFLRSAVRPPMTTKSRGPAEQVRATLLHLLLVQRRFSTIIAWPRMAGIADFRLPIPDGRWKELPHHFFNRQSAISNENLLFGCGYGPRCASVSLWLVQSVS